jgi:enoyl-CoA hydratase/carnithine racemase
VAPVLYNKGEGIATIQLNRPEARNSLTVQLLEEMYEAVVDASADLHVKVMIFKGDEHAFSSGADLKTVGALLDDWPRYVQFVHRLDQVFLAVEEAPMPTIAMVRGYALAGGLELLLCCDLALAADDAKIGDQHANFGLMAGGGGIPRLIRRIGLQPALEILFTGKWLSGKEAATIGIVRRSVPDSELEDAVMELAASLTNKSRTSLQYVKRAAMAGLGLPMRAALDQERYALFEYFTSSPDPMTGIKAFIEKRIPKFPD